MLFHHPTLAALTTSERQELIRNAKLVQLRKNQMLLSAGVPHRHWYMVSKGVLRVEAPPTESYEGATTNFLGKGTFVLGDSFEDSYVFPFNVVAVLDTDLFQMPMSVLRKLLQGNAQFATDALERALAHVTKLRKQIARINQAPADVVVGRALYELALLNDEGVLVMDKRVTQGVVASYLGMSREQVNKVLRGLEARGLVQRVESGYQVDESLALSGLAPLEDDDTFPPSLDASGFSDTLPFGGKRSR